MHGAGRVNPFRTNGPLISMFFNILQQMLEKTKIKGK